MKIEDVFITCDHSQVEDGARQLVHSTLAVLEPAIDIVAVKVSRDNTSPMATSGFHCTILLRSKDGAITRAEARDCDEMLAVYKALDEIIRQIQPATMVADPSMEKKPAQTADPF